MPGVTCTLHPRPAPVRDRARPGQATICGGEPEGEGDRSTRMPGNKCDECGTKINRLKTPYKFKHGNHTHAFCDPP